MLALLQHNMLNIVVYSLLTVSYPFQADGLVQKVLFIYLFQQMIKLIPNKDSHEVFFEQVLKI